MRISEWRAFKVRALKLRKRLLGVGKPGVGKSRAWMRRPFTQEAGYDYIPICAPLQSPVKIGGYPRPPLKPTAAMQPIVCLTASRGRCEPIEPTLLVFDDLGMAGGETLKAIVDLVQFGRIDNRTMPSHVIVHANTNDVRGTVLTCRGLIEAPEDSGGTLHSQY